MKLNFWLVSSVASLTAFMVAAQDSAPAPAASKKKPASARKIVLDPPVAATVKNPDVNIRGRASFTGETLGHLQKGDAVTVLEQITLRHPAKDEPADWAEITLPPAIPVWVNADFVDSAAKTIKARRINLRGGPGENFSVVGRMEKGAAIKEIKKEKGWIAIEAPTNAYAFVAAEFLEMQPAAAPVVTAPAPVPVPAPAPSPAPEAIVNVPTAPAPVAVAGNDATAPVPAPAPVAATPVPAGPTEKEVELAALRQAENNTNAPASISTPAPVLAPTSTEPEAPRIVTREGFVRRSYNVQAPTDFELHEIQNGTLIDYLQPKKGQNFKIFVGTRVTVTGPEGVDRRWPRTPVLDVQSVDLMP